MRTELTRAMTRLLLLPILIVGLGILVKGYVAVGDGFSAGVIAAIAVLLQYLVCGYEEVERFLPFERSRWLVTIGLLLVLIVSFSPLLAGEPILTHFPRPGAHVVHVGALELHTAILFDAGVFLLVAGFIISTAHALSDTAGELSP